MAARLRCLLASIGLTAVCLQSSAEEAKNQAPGANAAQQPLPAQIQPAVPADTNGLQSRALVSAIDKILKRAAAERAAARNLPVRDMFLLPPIWSETREERENSVRELLDGALEIVTDAPILKLQDGMRKQREKLTALKEQLSELRERRLDAPPSGLLPGILSETQDSIDKKSGRLRDDIKAREEDILRMKQEIGRALAAAGVNLSQDQLDLLLDSVLGGDLLKLVTAFEVAKIADQRLGTLVKQSGEDLKAARRYFAMHAALFAMLVHAQEILIDRIDGVYLARLEVILKDIGKTRNETRQLLEAHTRDDQRRALGANLKSQEISEKVALFYRDYLLNQRKMLSEARQKTLFDLRVADNTYETVEASFQLRALMDEARTSFEALQRLEAPGLDQIFRNGDLRREFENLTQKLGPSS
jgi:hypothetical protein